MATGKDGGAGESGSGNSGSGGGGPGQTQIIVAGIAALASIAAAALAAGWHPWSPAPAPATTSPTVAAQPLAAATSPTAALPAPAEPDVTDDKPDTSADLSGQWTNYDANTPVMVSQAGTSVAFNWQGPMTGAGPSTCKANGTRAGRALNFAYGCGVEYQQMDGGTCHASLNAAADTMRGACQRANFTGWAFTLTR